MGKMVRIEFPSGDPIAFLYYKLNKGKPRTKPLFWARIPVLNSGIFKGHI